MCRLTVFTPTYNRSNTLPRLYSSLRRQTCKDFCWLIVDDGSTDNTIELVERWKHDYEFKIIYLYQDNHGKMFAHNIGVKNTSTSLFVCVDSDDYLTDDAVETIINEDVSMKECIGILYKKGESVDRPVTSWSGSSQLMSMFDAEKKHHLSGDSMLVFKTDVIKKISFPVIPGEKFVPESYLYDKLSQIGKMKFVNKVLYICEYLPGGYSDTIRKVNALNPRGYECYIQNRLKMDLRFKDRFPDTIRLVAILFVMKKPKLKKCPYKFIGIISIPFGFMFYFKHYKRYIK